MIRPAMIATSSVLVHVPGLVRLGSKPGRELMRDPALADRIAANLRTFDDAVGYAPNQAFVGAIHPRAMGQRPYFNRRLGEVSRFGPDGEIMPESEFVALMAIADRFKRIRVDQTFAHKAAEMLGRHPLASRFDLKRIESAIGDVRSELAHGAICIHHEAGVPVASLAPGHAEDSNLAPVIMAENLACKASGALALIHLLHRNNIDPASIDYVIGCSEEAVGDRYQRGGGNMGKAIAEMAGCVNASGADVKNFCAAPIPAIVVAASLVLAGVFRRVAVVGGGSLAKLGMKFEGDLKHSMPILEDTLGAVATVVGPDDGVSPLIRLDSVGCHKVGSGASAEAIMDSILTAPLERIGLRIDDIDEYVTELHNPEITQPQGGGNVPERNYRIIAAMAVRRGLLERGAIADFVTRRGIPGFAPTQGHIASAFCYLGHARRALVDGNAWRIMMLAKGSLFLGMMTEQSDGMSFIIERNGL